MFKLIDYLIVSTVLSITILVGFLPKITKAIKKISIKPKPKNPNSSTDDYAIDYHENDELYLHNKTTLKPSPKTTSFLFNSISLVIGFQSTISVIGLPVEFYFYGFKSLQMTFSVLLGPVIVAYIFVPFIYKIKSNSIYEYLEDKFDGNKSVKIFILILGVIFQCVFASLVLFSTSIAILNVFSSFSVSLWQISLFLGLISALLALLGLKSVVLANFIQFAIMVACHIAIIVLGVMNYSNSSFTQGLSDAWDKTKSSGHAHFFVFSENLRSRYTVWNCLIGLMFNTVPSYCLTQQSFMRIKQAKSMSQAKLLVLSIIPVGFLNLSLIILVGFVMFLYNDKCGDPLSSGLIQNQNQLLTSFLTQFYDRYNGLLGLYIALLISSGIGTLSSVLKALSVTLYEDIIVKLCLRPNKSDEVHRENSFLKRRRLSHAQTQFLYEEELIELKIEGLESKNVNKKKLLKKYLNKRRNDGKISKNISVLIIVMCSVVLVLVSVLLGLIPGSLMSVTFSLLNAIHGPTLFTYLCARFNEYSEKRHKYAFNRSLKSKLRNFKLKSKDVIFSCLISIVVVEALFFGRLMTNKEAGEFYNSEMLSVSGMSVNQTVSKELTEFCRYEKSLWNTTSYDGFKGYSKSMLDMSDQNQNELSSLNYLFAISFNWYPLIGFVVCLTQLFVLNIMRSIFGIFSNFVSNRILKWFKF